MYLGPVQVEPVAVMDSIDRRCVFASVQVVPVAVVDSIDNSGVLGVCTGSTSGCDRQY